MKKLKRLLLLPLITLTLLMSLSLTALAYSEEDNVPAGWSGNGTSGSGGQTSSGWSAGIPNSGASRDNSGWLMYICDGYGERISSLVFITSNSGALTDNRYYDSSGNRNKGYVSIELTPRIGSGSKHSVDGSGIIFGMRPWKGASENHDGYGTEIKEWLITEQAAHNGEIGAYALIKEYFGADACQAFVDSAIEDANHSYILVIESAIWHGRYLDEAYGGSNVCYTVKGWASFNETNNNSLRRDTYHLSKIDNWIHPVSSGLEWGWLNQRIPWRIDEDMPSGSGEDFISHRHQKEQGYGCIMVRAVNLATGNKKVIKSFYEDENTLEETTTEPCSTTVDMQEEDYTVVEWVTTTEEISPDPPSSKEYSDIIAGVPITRTDDEEEVLELTEEELTVVIKYIKEPDNSPYTIVKSYYNDNTFVKTKVSTTSDTDYTIDDESQYEVTEYFTASQEPVPSPTRTTKWDTIISRYNDSDTLDYSFDNPDVPKPIEFKPDDGEPKTVFIKYEKTGGTPPPEVEVESDDVLEAWELSYIFPDNSGHRLGKTSADTLLTLVNPLLVNATGTYVNKFAMTDASGTRAVTSSDIYNSVWNSPLKVEFSYNGIMQPLVNQFSSKYSGEKVRAYKEKYFTT